MIFVSVDSWRVEITEQPEAKRIWQKLARSERGSKYYQKIFLSLSVRNSFLFMFWFQGGFFYYWRKYGYNVYNILVGVNGILLELCYWSKEDESFLRKTNFGFWWQLSSIVISLVFNQFWGIFTNSWNKNLWVYILLYVYFYLPFAHGTFFIVKEI